MSTKAIATSPNQPTSHVTLTQGEEDARTAEEATWNAGADARTAAEERDWRDEELKATDFWGASDQTMTGSMTTYRQELRDMPTLTGFPNSHTRPTES